MGDQNCSSPTKSSAIASHTENADGEKDKYDSLSSPCESRISSEKVCFGGEKNASCDNQSRQSNISNEGTVRTGSRNGVSDVCSNKLGTFLRPSALSGGHISVSGGTNAKSPPPPAESQSGTKCPLKSPRLSLTPSKFGNIDSSTSSGLTTKLPFQHFKNPFLNAAPLDSDKNESSASNSQTELPGTGELISKPFSTFTSTKPIVNSSSTSSSVLTTNFVFGQNLHERVADGIATTTNSEKSGSEVASSNGASDMLFTSVLTSTEIKNNITNESTQGGTQEPSSLIEDAARYEEARANKRKYEEVLVTTGEEDEENILQVNVKLFAFDNSTWVERGRGTLRLNDKNCDGTVISRIVIRTIGSLRVVLNTKIWSGMLLSRASQRSIRITAMDPNGQLKIFLIQASPKDMSTLFRYLDIRLKRCQENQGEPERKKLEKDNEGDEESKT